MPITAGHSYSSGMWMAVKKLLALRYCWKTETLAVFLHRSRSAAQVETAL